MRYILKSVVVKLDTKINLIITKINNKTSVDVLKEYISSITEISELAEVWDSRYPSLNNSYKEKIGQALIKAKYVSQRRSKNYLKIWIPKNQIETIMADHLL